MMQTKWEYFAVVIFENGRQKDVTGFVNDCEDRLEASKRVRSLVRDRFDDVSQVIIEELEMI